MAQKVCLARCWPRQGLKNALHTSAWLGRVRSDTKDVVRLLFEKDARTASPNEEFERRDRRNRGYPKLEKLAAKEEKVPKQAKINSLSLSSPLYEFPRHNRLQNFDIVPGDLVEARRSNVTSVGVILPTPDDANSTTSGRSSTLVLVLATGEVEMLRSSDVMLHIPKFVPTELAMKAAPLSWNLIGDAKKMDSPGVTGTEGETTEQTPSSDVEPFDFERFSSRATICRKIRDMQRETDQEMRRLSPIFQNMFLRDADLDTNTLSFKKMGKQEKLTMEALGVLRTGLISTSQVMEFLHRSGSKKHQGLFHAATYAATHSLLMNHPLLFLADALSHRRTQLFSYRSPREQQILKKVTKWVKDLASETPSLALAAKGIVDGFCDRARYVLAQQPAHRTTAGTPTLSQQVRAKDSDEHFTWTESDQDIIEFLKNGLGYRREIQDNLYGSAAMTILKRVGVNCETPPVSIDETVPPVKHESTASSNGCARLSTEVTTAGMDLQHDQIFQFLIRIGALAPWENPQTLDPILRAYDHGFVSDVPLSNDAAERHDFGDLPVYVIDDESAHELDDGISVEPTGERGKLWVHIHIADPTASIPYDHPLAQLAKQRFSSIYFPEATWPMLPTSVTDQGLGLNERDVSTNVLTFSGLIELDNGKIHDYMVRCGRVKNVNTVSYSEVNDDFSRYIQSTTEEISDQKTRDLLMLAKAASALLRRRIQNGGVNFSNTEVQVDVGPLPLPSLVQERLSSPQIFKGSPTVQLFVGNSDDAAPIGTYDGLRGGITSESMVAEFMILAGRIAASFGIKHNLPLPFQGQPMPGNEEIQFIDSRKDPLTGYLSFSEVTKHKLILSAAASSSKPETHYALGIRGCDANDPNCDALSSGGYVKVTSPLRRYPDMVAHWQLKAVLAGVPPPYDLAELDRELIRYDRLNSWSRQVEKATKRYWVWTAIDQLQKKKDQYDSEGRTNYEHYFTQTEKTLLGPLQAQQNIMEVRFNADNLESRVRVNLPILGGHPADCIWPLGKSISSEIETVKIIKTINAGTKHTILCEKI